jgi:hypothetical protein
MGVPMSLKSRWIDGRGVLRASMFRAVFLILPLVYSSSLGSEIASVPAGQGAYLQEAIVQLTFASKHIDPRKTDSRFDRLAVGLQPAQVPAPSERTLHPFLALVAEGLQVSPQQLKEQFVRAGFDVEAETLPLMETLEFIYETFGAVSLEGPEHIVVRLGRGILKSEILLVHPANSGRDYSISPAHVGLRAIDKSLESDNLTSFVGRWDRIIYRNYFIATKQFNTLGHSDRRFSSEA